MRINSTDKIWMVADPGPASQLVDILFDTTLEELHYHLGDLVREQRNPTLFTDEVEAEQEADRRLEARAAKGDVCSICRRVHGAEIIHACE